MTVLAITLPEDNSIMYSIPALYTRTDFAHYSNHQGIDLSIDGGSSGFRK
jgi:hypothetical protein